MKLENLFCDPITGECLPADLGKHKQVTIMETDKEIIYVGDPMCSWCWGISNHLKELKAYFPQFRFSIVVGGLRPGGGDTWDNEFKSFLKHHWKEVTERSGQPFGYDLFEREEFKYDTEPPCRAVVAARNWVGEDELSFYEAVSRKFYVGNEDPNESSFYQSICEQFNIPFAEFLSFFESDEVKYATNQEFQLNRQWGVKGYPTVIFKLKDQLFQINHGYTEFEVMKSKVEKIIASEDIEKN